MKEKKIQSLEISRFKNGLRHEVEDFVVIEEPLEIRLGFGPINDRSVESINVTMRTPGNDELLAIGFLFSEQIILSIDDIYKLGLLNPNVIMVELKTDKFYKKGSVDRNFYSNSACGICGKTSLESLNNLRYSDLSLVTNSIRQNVILGLSDALRSKQILFEKTGGLHSAGLFTTEGEFITQMEDIGRHNALDKIVGYILQEGLDNKEKYMIMLSGRIGYELIHKTLRIGISIIAAVGSPSSLSIEMADKHSLSVIGFLRKGQFNVYTHQYRIIE